MAYMLRFGSKLKKRMTMQGALSVEEINEASKIIIKKVQLQDFENEIETLEQNKKLLKPLRKLTPFIDKEGIFRVGGRLEHADVSYDRKHPILLSSSSHVSTMIIRHYHLTLHHAGATLVLSRLQDKYWIVGGMKTVKKVIRCCVKCTRMRAETCQQLMGQLPQARVNPARAFLNSGVDFAGPFILRNAKGRNPIQYKGYVVVFICLVTRAVHLDIVSDMTSFAFLESFKRFVSVRGIPSDVFSDCGTNFVGADRELKDYTRMWNQEDIQDDIKNYMTNQGVNWHLSTDPSDAAALTPGHFLIGEPLKAIPVPNLINEKYNRLTRWEMISQLLQQFWKRWSSEQLSRMQEKPKWWTDEKNLEIGNLVLIKDDNAPPLMWKMGRIIEVKPGQDGKVRVVRLKTQHGELTRPIVKLCLLPTG